MPNMQLFDFARVGLRAGGSAQVCFAVCDVDVGLVRPSDGARLVLPGTYHLLLDDGASTLTTSLTVAAAAQRVIQTVPQPPSS
jgi:hypothetical protein